MQALAIQDIWLAGWCGGLNPDLHCGDIILPDCVVTEAGTRIPLATSPRIEAIAEQVARDAGVRVHSGSVLSSQRVVHDSREKLALENAIAVEMEAQPLQEWATETQKGFFHLRVVLDPVTSSLPQAGFWNILLFWKQAKSINRFFWHARKANQVLARLVESIVKDGLPDAIQNVNSGGREQAGCNGTILKALDNEP